MVSNEPEDSCHGRDGWLYSPGPSGGGTPQCGEPDKVATASELRKEVFGM